MIDAPLGEVGHEPEPFEDVAGRVLEWTREQLAAGLPTVLVVDSALDGIEIVTRLLAEGVPVAVGKALRDAAAAVAGLAAVPALRAPGREPAVVIRVEGERAKPVAREVRALVSYRAIDPSVASGFTASFAWPFVAGRTQLLAWIEQTRASQIFVTGASADAIAQTLGARARVVGPPRQMALFAI